MLALVPAMIVGQPANDNFANAAVLTGWTSVRIDTSNVGATKESGELNHAGNAGGHSLWWKWEAKSASPVIIQASKSPFPALLAVYVGAGMNTLTAVSASASGILALSPVPGTTYFLAVDGADGAAGSVSLTFEPHMYTTSTLAGALTRRGSDDGTGSVARFNVPRGLAIDACGTLAVADGDNGTIRVVSPAGAVTTLAGTPGQTGAIDGMGAAARFSVLRGMAFDAAGNIYVADSDNHAIRKITPAGAVSTFAGKMDVEGAADGDRLSARFRKPRDIAVDPVTGNMYVADFGNYTIRKISRDGRVATLAGLAGLRGTSDGFGSEARFLAPFGLALGPTGDVFVTDVANHTIRKVTAAGLVTTFAGTAGLTGNADGVGVAARFNFPEAIAADAAGNLYVSEEGNQTIRKVTPTRLAVTLFKMDIPPLALAVDAAGNLYWTGTNHAITKAVALSAPITISRQPSDAETASGQTATFTAIAPATNHQWERSTDSGRTWLPLADSSTFAGTGTAQLTVKATTTMSGDMFRVAVGHSLTSSIFSTPAQLTVVPAYDVSTLAGGAGGYADGVGLAAKFMQLTGLALGPDGNLYVGDTGNLAIRKVTRTGVVSTIRSAEPVRAQSLAVARDGKIYLTQSGMPAVRSLSGSGAVATVAGSLMEGGTRDGIGDNARFLGPNGVAAIDDRLFVTDRGSIRQIVLPGTVSTFAGVTGMGSHSDGIGAQAGFFLPNGIAADQAGNLFVADSGAKTIRKITASGRVTTLAGYPDEPGHRDGVGAAARFGTPWAIAADSSGNLFVTDAGNATLRRVSPSGAVTTVAGRPGWIGVINGRGSAALFLSMRGIAVDDAGVVYVTDVNFGGAGVVRKAVPAYDRPGIKGPLTASGTVGVRFTYAIIANSNPVMYTAAGLPPGLTINATTGLISGTPTRVGSTTVTLGATNSSGTGLAELVLEVRAVPLPEITTQPIATSAMTGSTARFTVAATSAASLSYQWQALAIDGVTWTDLSEDAVCSGTRTPTLSVATTLALNQRQFRVVVRDSYGGVSSSDAVALTVTLPARLVNLSTRGSCLTGDNVLIPGFVIAGTTSKRLLIRALGPALASFGVTGVLADPRLVVKRLGGTGYVDVATNEDWGSNANIGEIVATSAHCGAFALPNGSRDAVLLLDLAPGQYTVLTSGGAGTGIAIVELYDTGANSETSRLANIATRGYVGTGDAIMIPGFVVSDEGPRTLLIRAVGPTLGHLGVSGALSDPQLMIFRQNANGTTTALFGNDDWGLDSNAAATATTAARVGAFAFAAGSKDAALVATLQPGVYTVLASGVGNLTGTALVEVYEVP